MWRAPTNEKWPVFKYSPSHTRLETLRMLLIFGLLLLMFWQYSLLPLLMIFIAWLLVVGPCVIVTLVVAKRRSFLIQIQSHNNDFLTIIQAEWEVPRLWKMAAKAPVFPWPESQGWKRHSWWGAKNCPGSTYTGLGPFLGQEWRCSNIA